MLIYQRVQYITSQLIYGGYDAVDKLHSILPVVSSCINQVPVFDA